MLSIRDPIHGFIRADAFEATLIDSRPMQRLRSIHQLGWTSLVFPGAEHSRFAHALGAMELAGRAFDALASRATPDLAATLGAPERRLVRAAALLHDLGHAPFSHSAEEQFADGIDHEEMTRRLVALPEIVEVFARRGEGLAPEQVTALLARRLEHPAGRLLSQVVSGELDVDKMDYLLRDSLYCGVRYGSYDLARLLDTLAPLPDPQTGQWGIGVDEGGVHAVEALVMARYYMFTQVYFNVTGKALELHFSEWLRSEGRRWPSEPRAFLALDDVWALAEMRRSTAPHARAVIERRHYPLAFETREHLLVSNSGKDPHRLGPGRVLVRRFGGRLEPMEEASQFIRFLARIERFRIYARPELRDEVAAFLRRRWEE